MRNSAVSRTLSALLALTLVVPLGVFSVQNVRAFDYTQCSNGIDDDRDGLTDYPRDRECDSLDDETEARAMHSRFMEIWAASFPGVSSTTAGL